MRIVTVREFRDHATKMFRSHEAILVTKRGHVSGFYFPSPAKTFPIDLKREALKQLVSSLKWKKASSKEEKSAIGQFLVTRKNRG
ncbi:MAG: hypothetical protein HYT97_02710 [Elusimicrobia bacterium]|nr:hypothetical protein [Elusimicrobiota bacterium]